MKRSGESGRPSRADWGIHRTFAAPGNTPVTDYRT